MMMASSILTIMANSKMTPMARSKWLKCPIPNNYQEVEPECGGIIANRNHKKWHSIHTQNLGSLSHKSGVC
jgi:hypothetical protein